jgi:hypothetical protein
MVRSRLMMKVRMERMWWTRMRTMSRCKMVCRAISSLLILSWYSFYRTLTSSLSSNRLSFNTS